MERARELGFARSVGVSNFSARELEEVKAAGTIPQAVNQVQFSSLQYRRALLDACRRGSVALETHSPLGVGARKPTILRARMRLQPVLRRSEGFLPPGVVKRLTASGSVGGDALPPVHRLSGFG
jgi:diketogulonate reductase-like aldo/keto reductase